MESLADLTGVDAAAGAWLAGAAGGVLVESEAAVGAAGLPDVSGTGVAAPRSTAVLSGWAA